MGMSPQDYEYLLVTVRAFLNSKEWVDTAIQIAGSKRGGSFESSKRITNCIHLIVQAGCCVAFRRAAVLSSRRPLTAPPSRRLIAQAGCCVASCCTTVSSSHCATLSSSHCAVWLLCFYGTTILRRVGGRFVADAEFHGMV